MTFSTNGLSLIREFFHEGGIYFHYIAPRHNDEVILTDFDGKPLLRYSSSCDIQEIDEDKHHLIFDRKQNVGQQIGRIFLRDEGWCYQLWNDDAVMSKYTLDHVEGVLDCEVIISKLWLSKKFPLGNIHV